MPSGYVGTAVMSIPERQLRLSARYALIPRDILKKKRRIIKKIRGSSAGEKTDVFETELLRIFFCLVDSAGLHKMSCRAEEPFIGSASSSYVQ